MLRFETARLLRRWTFWVAIVLGLLLLVPGLRQYNEGPKNIPGQSPYLYNVYEAFMWAEKTTFILFVPLLAVLPAADTYVVERTTGYLNAILMRCRYRRYVVARFVANLLAGGLAIALPLGLMFIANHFFFARGLAPPHQMRLRPDGPASSLYYDTPSLYILFLIGLGFLVGAVYATLGMAIAFWTANRYVVLATPLVLYHVANFVLGTMGLAAWTPPITFYPEGANSSTWLTIFGELGFIFGVSLLLIAWRARRETAVLNSSTTA